MSEASDHAIDLAFCKELEVLYDGIMRALIVDRTALDAARIRARVGIEDALLARDIMKQLIKEIENGKTT